MDQAHRVTLELINTIFLEYSPEYHHIKELAEKDLGQELIDRIEDFLKGKHDMLPEELRKVVFEDASKFREEELNDIVDAFVKFRSSNTLSEIDMKSIDDILIIFNQWIRIGKDEGQSRVDLGNVVVESLPQQQSLEQQVLSMPQPGADLYASVPFETKVRGLYSSDTDIYHDLASDVEFLTRSDHAHDDNPYMGKATYKSH